MSLVPIANPGAVAEGLLTQSWEAVSVDISRDGQQGRDLGLDSNPVVGLSLVPVVNPGAVDGVMLERPGKLRNGRQGRDPRLDSNPAVNPGTYGQWGMDLVVNPRTYGQWGMDPVVNPRTYGQQGRDSGLNSNPGGGLSRKPVANPGAVTEGLLDQLWEEIHALTQSTAAVQDLMLELLQRLSAPAEGGIWTATAVTATPGSVGQVSRTAGDGERLVLEAIHGLTQSNVAVQSLMLEVIQRLSASAEGGIWTAKAVTATPGSVGQVAGSDSAPVSIGRGWHMDCEAVIATPGSVGQVLRATDDGKSLVATKKSVSEAGVGGDVSKPNKKKRTWRCRNCMAEHSERCPEPVNCFNCSKIGHKKKNCTEPVGNRCKRFK